MNYEHGKLVLKAVRWTQMEIVRGRLFKTVILPERESAKTGYFLSASRGGNLGLHYGADGERWLEVSGGAARVSHPEYGTRYIAEGWFKAVVK